MMHVSHCLHKGSNPVGGEPGIGKVRVPGWLLLLVEVLLLIEPLNRLHMVDSWHHG